jgi:hypothetical protein
VKNDECRSPNAVELSGINLQLNHNDIDVGDFISDESFSLQGISDERKEELPETRRILEPWTREAKSNFNVFRDHHSIENNIKTE